MITLMMLAATTQAASWDALESEAGWSDVGTRTSSVGEVHIRRKRIDETTCLEGDLRTALPVEALLAVGRDMGSADRWSSAKLAASEELWREGDRYALFQYFDVPGWTLAADRFWTITVSVDASRDRFRWERIDAATLPAVQSKAMALSAGAVEPPVNYGEWQFTRVDGGTHIRYRACADMGGALPDAIQRWVSTSQLPETVSDLVREAERRH